MPSLHCVLLVRDYYLFLEIRDSCRVVTDLTDLHLSINCPTSTSLFKLTALRSLTLYHASSSLMQTLLNPAAVPNLRAFALVDAEEEYAEYLLETEISALLPQLDVFSIELDVWTSLNAEFRHSIAIKTLVDCTPRGDSIQVALTKSTRALNIRLYSDPIDTMSNPALTSISAGFAVIAAILDEAESPILTTFYLDQRLQASQILPLTLSNAVKGFVKVCEQRSIEIVWEESPVDFEVDPVISPEFWRRQRERRELEGDQAK